jgi:hypothetical protein
MSGKSFKLVWSGFEFLAGEFGDLGGDLYIKAFEGVYSLNQRSKRNTVPTAVPPCARSLSLGNADSTR